MRRRRGERLPGRVQKDEVTLAYRGLDEVERRTRIHFSPTPDLLTLQSTSSADDRYQKIVNDFQSFGPAGFRETVAQARQRLLRS